MTSVQRFLANDRNLVAAGTVTASSVAESNVVRTATVSREGNGRVRLTGDYTGHEDTIIDVKIASGGSTLRASTPTLVGVGNGTLSVESVGAPAVAETWTLTLVDLGTDTTHAQIQVESVVIRALVAGADGNLVRLEVVPDLTETATDYSLLADWPAGTETLSGPEYDFGGLPLSAKGELDASSPRLRFGTDHVVYRPYRVWQDDAWRYGLTPPPPRAIAAGTRVYEVSGGYDITVTDGTDTETHDDIVTFYDLLAALAASDLVEVDGVVVADRQPGGMAMRDVPLRTSSWVLRATGVTLDGVVPADDAPTETITIECVNADAVGAEVWSVSGTVSGVIGSATTGVAYTSDVIGFTVPDLSDTVSGSGSWRWSYIPTTRGVGEETPSVGVVDFMLGINARPGTYTFTLEEIPDVEGCDYSLASIDGRVTAACLGLSGTEGDMDATLQTKLTTLHAWHSGFVDRITVYGPSSHFSTPKITLAARIVNIFSAAMQDVYASATAVSQWDTELTKMQADMEVFDSAYGSSSPVSLTFPYTGTLNVGTVYTISSVNYMLRRAILTSGGEVQGSVPVSAMAAPSLVSTTDGDQTVVVGSYTLTFSRRESNLKDVVIEEGEASSVVTTWEQELAGLVAKYEAAMAHVRVLAGILPKSNASSAIGTGDGCWRDSPDATMWWVPDSGHLPAYTNRAWITSKASTDSGASAGVPVGEPFSTREFGMAIAAGCSERLLPGDKIVIVIQGVDGGRPYAVGSVATLDVVTAGPAYLAGGVDGDDTHVWSVLGSTSGAHPDYEVPSDGSPVPAYTDDGVEIQLAHGGIDWALGDTWTFAVESGQFLWRQDGGAWSSPVDIDDEVVLAAGLSAAFAPGASPSFVADDAWTFAVEQPGAPSHIQAPDTDAWSWDGASATLVVDLGGTETIESVAVARYALPAGAVVSVQGGDGSTWPNTVTLDATGKVAAAMLETPWSVTHLRLSVSSATGGEIGWLWAGAPLATEYSATTCVINRVYGITRGAGINPGSLYAGCGTGGELAWEGGWLTQTDLDALLAMLDAMQEDDAPMILIPHVDHADEAALVRVDTDTIRIEDVHEFQPDDKAHRRISMSIPLTAVIQ